MNLKDADVRPLCLRDKQPEHGDYEFQRRAEIAERIAMQEAHIAHLVRNRPIQYKLRDYREARRGSAAYLGTGLADLKELYNSRCTLLRGAGGFLRWAIFRDWRRDQKASRHVALASTAVDEWGFIVENAAPLERAAMQAIWPQEQKERGQFFVYGRDWTPHLFWHLACHLHEGKDAKGLKLFERTLWERIKKRLLQPKFVYSKEGSQQRVRFSTSDDYMLSPPEEFILHAWRTQTHIFDVSSSCTVCAQRTKIS